MLQLVEVQSVFLCNFDIDEHSDYCFLLDPLVWWLCYSWTNKMFYGIIDSFTSNGSFDSWFFHQRGSHKNLSFNICSIYFIPLCDCKYDHGKSLRLTCLSIIEMGKSQRLNFSYSNFSFYDSSIFVSKFLRKKKDRIKWILWRS